MTESSSAPSTDPDVLTSDPVSDPTLRRFEPDDGLFLRAPHLRQISTYAEEFALVAGAATGAGVDHGLDVTLSDGKLIVSPGLAVDGCAATAAPSNSGAYPASPRLQRVDTVDRRDPGRRIGADRQRTSLREALRRSIQQRHIASVAGCRGADPSAAGTRRRCHAQPDGFVLFRRGATCPGSVATPGRQAVIWIRLADRSEHSHRSRSRTDRGTGLRPG